MEKQQNNSQQKYESFSDALEALANDLESGKFEQDVQSDTSSTSEKQVTEQPKATMTLDVRFVPNLKQAVSPVARD